MKDSIEVSHTTAAALDGLVGPVTTVNVDLATMAWLAWILPHMRDDPSRFPRGKWATIQHIEEQLEMAARDQAARFDEGRSDRE